MIDLISSICQVLFSFNKLVEQSVFQSKLVAMLAFAIVQPINQSNNYHRTCLTEPT